MRDEAGARTQPSVYSSVNVKVSPLVQQQLQEYTSKMHQDYIMNKEGGMDDTQSAAERMRLNQMLLGVHILNKQVMVEIKPDGKRL